MSGQLWSSLRHKRNTRCKYLFQIMQGLLQNTLCSELHLCKMHTNEALPIQWSNLRHCTTARSARVARAHTGAGRRLISHSISPLLSTIGLTTMHDMGGDGANSIHYNTQKLIHLHQLHPGELHINEQDFILFRDTKMSWTTLIYSRSVVQSILTSV